MNTIEIDAGIKGLNDQKSTLHAELEAVQERAAKSEREKDSVRSLALRNDDATAKSKLNELRQAIAVAQLSASDIADEIAKLDAEIANLQAARAESVRLEAWADFLKLAEQVKTEAMNIDVLVAEFFQSLAPHSRMLQELNSLLARSGMEVKKFSMVDFQRALDVRFREEFAKYFGASAHFFKRGSQYEQDYCQILSAKIANIAARHDGIPVEETTERVPRMVISSYDETGS